MSNVKICASCLEIKYSGDFRKDSSKKDGLRCSCAICEKARVRAQYADNREFHLARNKEWRSKNPDKVKESQLTWRESHREYLAEKERIRKTDPVKKARADRQTKIWLASEEGKTWRAENHQKRKLDPKYSAEREARKILRRALERTGVTKSRRTEEVIGITSIELQHYLVNTYKQRYGVFPDMSKRYLYHVDHIIPIVTASSVEDVYRLNHYTNLQLLKASDNLSKSDRLDWE
jgi:hypothetical protein